MKILLATDGSKHSIHAVKFAIRLLGETVSPGSITLAASGVVRIRVSISCCFAATVFTRRSSSAASTSSGLL